MTNRVGGSGHGFRITPRAASIGACNPFRTLPHAAPRPTPRQTILCVARQSETAAGNLPDQVVTSTLRVVALIPVFTTLCHLGANKVGVTFPSAIARPSTQRVVAGSKTSNSILQMLCEIEACALPS